MHRNKPKKGKVGTKIHNTSPYLNGFHSSASVSNSTVIGEKQMCAPGGQSNIVCAQYSRIPLRRSHWCARYSSYITAMDKMNAMHFCCMRELDRAEYDLIFLGARLPIF